jgi:NAD(P)-dependent dehydrogenase (short-subunit alcohol dehydrogenase family)
VIGVEYTKGNLTRRQALYAALEVMRAVQRRSGCECDVELVAAINAANGLHLRTAYRHAKAAWSLWSVCWAAEEATRRYEAELAGMDAS